ncbi:hypothetical protein PUMCH_004353 [Australozyma saopauloensis]|uniref:Checkpoint protein n=1 Tax=Australozyma saopauloensis TaxID=291208 RepID=A0AAX4HGJ1_9ASCO|nr:hypothetical protein PUMCH_004353 [[Candida] saopauloensis]
MWSAQVGPKTRVDLLPHETMKLKLQTQSTETLRKCFSQINSLRKFVVLRFSPDELLAVLADESSVIQEPQVWCKFPMYSIFSDVEVISQRDNVILLEINIELFLQTLRNFDKANSRDFNIRLQRKEGAGRSRAAYLALSYSETTNSTINHTFRVPVKILKSNVLAKVPELPHVDIMMKLPPEFAATFRRLEKFRNKMSQDRVTIRASRENGGSLQFLLEEVDNYKVAITWKAKLEIEQKQPESDSLRAVQANAPVNERSPDEPVEVTVTLRDWRLAQKIVSNCKTIIFLMCQNNACVIHCLLDDAEEVEVMYYVSGIRSPD